MTNVELLKSKISERGLTLVFIAKELGMNANTLHNKLNARSDFKAWQMIKLSEILHLTKADQKAIFFAENVGK